MPTLSPEALSDFSRRLFMAAGVPEEEARVVTSNLVNANLRGHDSHGVIRVPQYVDFVKKGDYKVGVELKILKDSPGAVVCDGQWGFGQVQAHRLLDIVLPRARALGVSSGAAKHCGHIGRLGEYAERASDEGLVLLATVNNCGAGQRVAPPGGREPRLGTNPLCVSVPTNSDTILLDFGTSVAAEGKVRVNYFAKQPVPDGWLLDAEGRPTTNPAVLYEQPMGSILPMGGSQSYKGFGLGLVLDMLAGGLTGGRAAHRGAPPARGNNVLFIALDPSRFAGADELRNEASSLADYVRDTPTVEGVDRITLPGDPERTQLAARSAGGVKIEDGTWSRLLALAGELGVDPPEFC